MVALAWGWIIYLALDLVKPLSKQISIFWQTICLRRKIKCIVPKLIFHFPNIVGIPIFSGEFGRILKMVNFLMFLQSLINLRFTLEADARP